MRRPTIRSLFPVVAITISALVVAGCGGGDTSAAPDDAGEQETEVETADETETDSGGSPAADGPALAPGRGTLVLDDGRSFAITLTECEGEPTGTFSASGTSIEGSGFSFGNFYLGESWSQSQASIEFPNRDQIYVIVGRLAEGAEPAAVEGTSVTWVQTFRELDESANRHVYTGQGVLRLTCP